MEKSQQGLYLEMWDYLANSRQFLGRNRPVMADRQVERAQEILRTMMNPEIDRTRKL
jgi:hypothetical protein